ncbi:MAG: alpha/beta hydrolase [Marinifilaceae bacterium]
METKHVIIDLWPKGAPHCNRITESEEETNGKITNITNAQLYIYKPAEGEMPKKAIVIFPGGGFGALNMAGMGIPFAEWMVEQGYAAIVVKYRMPNENAEIITEDALQAMEMAYEYCSEWDIEQIGVAGFSIGGNTASWLCNVAPKKLRPSFQVLFYPVESLSDIYNQGKARDHFMGEQPTKELINEHSNELHVSEETPPTFITLAYDDPVVQPLATLQYVQALLHKNVPAAIYIFPTGGHGWTFNSNYTYLPLCKELLATWLKEQD